MTAASVPSPGDPERDDPPHGARTTNPHAGVDADADDVPDSGPTGPAEGDGVSETLESEDRTTRGAATPDGTEETGAAGSSGAESSTGGGSRSERGHEDLLVREGDIAGDYLEQLLDILDFDGDIDLDVEAGRAIVSIEGGKDLEKLVGARGDVLEALQELTRLTVQQSTGARNRLMLDIAGWRSQRRSELSDIGRQAAREVKESGESQRLRPMTPFERKVVHDAVAEVAGVKSESEGEEPRRRVVVLPAG